VKCGFATTCVLGLLATAQSGAAPALESDTFYSTDKAGFETIQQLVGWDIHRIDNEHYVGVALEDAHYSGPGFGTSDDRAYLRFADTRPNKDGTAWKWNAQLGFDQRTVVGNFEIYDERADKSRAELYGERDIVATREGTDLGLYSTLIGVADDFQLTPRLSATASAAFEDFTDDNTRDLARARLVYVVAPDYGISAQLRTRYFHDSDPNEFDYFSPRWYAEYVPTIAMRRFIDGNQFYVAIGYGRQRTSDRNWNPDTLIEASWTSPDRGRWFTRLSVGYTNTPVNTNDGYAYRYVNAQIVVPLR
jgi:hypothetical protein